MSEFRQNLATKEWVLIATERARRPDDFKQSRSGIAPVAPAVAADCPFCPGNEELDLERLRLPAGGDWQVRVVRNKYPAVAEAGDPVRQVDGLNCSLTGVGYHEVVVESRLHTTCPALQPAAALELTLQAFQLRGVAMRHDRRMAQILYFENHGPQAGSSLRHPHAQVVALPVVPYPIRIRSDEARRSFDDSGACVFCRMREAEEHAQERLVVASAGFTAFCPYAAYSPFHLWIIPRRHTGSFLDASPEEVRDLAQVLREVLARLYVGLCDPDYNYVIRSAPESERRAPYVHWYVAIVPRVSHRAGFELGSGMFINPMLPEASAAFLRSVALP
jgi:UDPglucose--hexose-1-phosphate uridylyltransferase